MQKRNVKFDVLKGLGILAVVGIHSVMHVFQQAYPMTSADFFIASLIDGISRWCVPVFIMVSGVLLLEKEESLAEVYTRRILFVFKNIVIWTIIYGLWTNKYELLHGDYLCLLSIAKACIKGPIYYHLWYLFMLLQLFIFLPVFRNIVKDKNITEYVILLCFGQSIFANCMFIRNTNLDNWIFFSGGFNFWGYFLLGFYVIKYKIFISKQLQISLMVISSLVTIGGHYIPNAYYWPGYTSLNVLVMSYSIFLILMNSNMKNTFLVYLGRNTFSIYLVHALFIDVMTSKWLPVGDIHNALWRISGIFIGTLFLSIVYVELEKKACFIKNTVNKCTQKSVN